MLHLVEERLKQITCRQCAQNLDLWGFCEFVWLKDNMQGRNLSRLCFWVSAGKSFKFFGLQNFGLYCTNLVISQKV